MSDDNRTPCSTCHVKLLPTDFNVMRTGKPTKTCKNCLNHQKQSRSRRKCEHGRSKYECTECGTGRCEHGRSKYRCILCGTGVCEHNHMKHMCRECGSIAYCDHGRRRTQCRECHGSDICNHNRQRAKCIDCHGSQMCNHNRQRDQCKVCSDPIKITIQNMIKGSKCKDKKLDRYDANNFIDYCFMEQLIEDEGRTCCYCEVELQYVEHNKTLATIERIDNSIGHTKANVRIACLECNTRRVGQRIPETS